MVNSVIEKNATSPEETNIGPDASESYEVNGPLSVCTYMSMN